MNQFKSAVILAGGKSSRMGFDKQFLCIKGIRLIDWLITTLKTDFEEIIIISNHPEDYKGSGCILEKDIIPDMGPLGGIHAGLKRASSKYVYFMACDMPNLNLDYIRYMKKRIAEANADACITKFGTWIEPLNAFYAKNITDELEADLLQGRSSIFFLTKKINTLFIEEKEARQFSPDWKMFLNLNTKEDLEKYLDSCGAN